MKLHEQNRAREARLNAILNEIARFKGYLDGPKFTGFDHEGNPKSYVATHEVAALLQRLKDEAEGFPADGGWDGL